MSASIVQLIDSSGSMVQESYFEPAKTDAGTFVNIQNLNDYVGVVSFASTVATVFNFTKVTSGVLSQASAAIENSAAINSGTNMKAGITSAFGMFSGNTATKTAIVMLSDGMYNDGGDPRPGIETTVPIYTIALGPHGEQKVLTDIANLTGGTYNFAPNAIQLADIYNEIVGESGLGVVLANDAHQIENFKFEQSTGSVSNGVTEATFVVNWMDENVKYTGGTPTPGEINVSLLQPDGTTANLTPEHVGKAYVVFKAFDPEPGTWTSVGWYRGSTTLQSQFGIFQPVTSSLKMETRLSEENTSIGNPISVIATIKDGDKDVDEARVLGSIEMPLTTFEQAKIDYSKEMASENPDQALIEDGVTEEDARLLAFRKRHLKDRDIMTREIRPLLFTRNPDGEFIAQLPETKIPGGYIVRLNASGHSKHSAGPFSRAKRISIHVT